jgi:hypothetical protein
VYSQARYTTGRRSTLTSGRRIGKIAEIPDDGGFTWQVALVERFGDGGRDISLTPVAKRRSGSRSHRQVRPVLTVTRFRTGRSGRR